MVFQGLKNPGFPFRGSEEEEGQWGRKSWGLPKNIPPDPKARRSLISLPGRQLQVHSGVAAG